MIYTCRNVTDQNDKWYYFLPSHSVLKNLNYLMAQDFVGDSCYKESDAHST